ncbi:MAG: YbaN family protein [Candidatus Thiodiazotropha sp. 6PLUC2]
MSEYKSGRKNSATEHPLSKLWLLAVGWLLFGLGVIGIVLPLMPTTIFWIGAVWCWSRSAPHLTKRILAHPRFGQPVYLFITYGQMTRTGKWMSLVGMTVGFALFQLLGNPGWPISLGVCLILALVAIWLWQRPEPVFSSDEQDAL